MNFSYSRTPEGWRLVNVVTGATYLVSKVELQVVVRAATITGGLCVPENGQVPVDMSNFLSWMVDVAWYE